jgi:DNA topoisomerase IB
MRIKHIVLSKPTEDNPQGVALNFFGKRRIKHQHPITNPILASALSAIAKSSQAKKDKNVPIFPDLGYEEALEAVRQLVGGAGFDPHDFRRAAATNIAASIIANLDAEYYPQTIQEARALVREVCEVASKVLGNKPEECYKTYIDPAVHSVLFPAEGFPPEPDPSEKKKKKRKTKTKAKSKKARPSIKKGTRTR